MSYEGYQLGWCEMGHACTVWDAWDEDPEHCSCGAKFRRVFQVDQTNGDENGDPRTNGTLRQTFGGRVERCNLGHAHIVEQPTFALVAEVPDEG